MEKISEYIRDNLKIIIGSLTIIVALGVFYLSKQEKSNDKKPENLEWSAVNNKKSEPEKETKEEKSAGDDIFVDVKGAVQNPGIYKLSAKHRVSDAIARAGGFTEEAERKAVNLAKKLQDEAEVYVPARGEVDTRKLLEGESGGAAGSEKEEKSKINLNTADLTELQQLSGVGAKKAQDIIDYRSENGNFKSVEDLGKVSDFGPKTLEKLRDAIAVD